MDLTVVPAALDYAPASEPAELPSETAKGRARMAKAESAQQAWSFERIYDEPCPAWTLT